MFAETDLPPHLRYLVTDRRTLSRARRDGRVWVATTSDDKAVGFALAVEIDGNAHLDELNVLPDHGCNGIGTALARTVIAWASASGYAALTLVTFRHVPWNAPFYARMGFAPLEPAVMGSGMHRQLQAEADAGLDASMRQAMVLNLQ